MKLREIRIQNFKSIEDAVIENIGNIDILCGRNNSGKSAIFAALNTVHYVSIFPTIGSSNISGELFTGNDFSNRVMNITLIFDADDDERLSAIKQYCGPTIQELGATATEEFMKELIKSGFLKRIWYEFRSFQGKAELCLYQIKTTGTDGKFSTIALRKNDTSAFSIKSIATLCNQRRPLTSETLEQTQLVEIGENTGTQTPNNAPFSLFPKFIERIYSFSPFRSSQRRMQAQETPELSANGDNLVQRLFSMKNNELEHWERLQKFVEMALPGLGRLEARVIGNMTETRFFDDKWNIRIDIHDMGSGVEQLLMIACVLISRMERSLILIETPEHHLHPGAQRTLLEFVRENLGKNQVSIATHSPIFLGQRDPDIHIVTMTKNGTKVKKVEELNDLSKALDELGSRNSDVLLADFVLFVEGPSDERILRKWAKTLDIDFDSRNIFCITIGGVRNFDYYANTDILKRISLKSPVPHLFVIDRDEKSDETIRKIQEQVRNLHILERREIENYLLTSRCLIEGMRTKAKGNQEIIQKLESVHLQEIDKQISLSMDELRHVVLMKRIKEELGGATFLPDDALQSLIRETENLGLNAMVDKIYEAIVKMLNEKCNKEKLRAMVEQQTSIVGKIWTEENEEEKKKVVLGEDILRTVFERYGLNYDKVKDGERIAQQMKKDEIPPEIKSVIEKLRQDGA